VRKKIDMRVLGVFAKYWAAGQVKTRLAKQIGCQAAAAFYREMLGTTLRRLEHAPADRRIVVYWPPESQSAFQSLAPAWKLTVQDNGDLGQRLSSYFQGQFEAGGTTVMALGSDCPHVPLDTIRQAWEHLQATPILWGPADDGGYYLVGLRKELPHLFHSIPWSSQQVLDTSRQRVQELGLVDQLLPPLSDIDNWDGLQRWIRDHANSPDPELRALAAYAAGLQLGPDSPDPATSE